MFQERIREHYDQLTPGFRKLADFMMTRTLDVAFLTATQLSRRVGVDPATVVRFSQELGYSGYRELSREIKSYVRDQITASYRSAAEAENLAELLKGLVDNAQQNMEQFMTTNLANIAQVVEALGAASHIWVAGEFADYGMAIFMAKQLSTLGMSTTAFQPSMGETASYIAQMKEGEIVLALTSSGPGLDTGYALRLAREKGLRTMCITGDGVALPAREAELTIVTPTDTPVEAASLNPFMQLLSLIWEALAQARTEATTAYQERLQGYMEQIRSFRTETPEYEIS